MCKLNELRNICKQGGVDDTCRRKGQTMCVKTWKKC